MRKRLLLLVTATMSLVLLAFLLPLALLLQGVAEDRAVTSATESAQSITSQVATTERSALDVQVQYANVNTPHKVTVFFADGTLIGPPAPRSPAVRAAGNGRSITAEAPGGREILTFARDVTGANAVIRAFVPESALSAGVNRAWLLLGLLGLGLLVIGIVVADRLAITVLRPTRELAAVSHRLAGGDLDARAVPEGPGEIREVAGAVNHLAGRIRELLAEERERIADLSHRLRTPLASLRLEAESLRSTEDAARITAAVDNLERSVTNIIAGARARNTSGEHPRTAVCDATAVLRDRAWFWSVLAEDTGRRMSVNLPQYPLWVPTSADDLAACVDALLGNVFAHTDDGVAFGVSLELLRSGHRRLGVADEGPGFGSGGHQWRRGVSGAGSSGLGLDIARRTAQTAGGSMQLGSSNTGGAMVLIDLPWVPQT